MKRNRFFVLGVLAMVLAFGLVLAGCDTDGGGGNDAFTWPDGLRGTLWEDSSGDSYSFVGDSDGDYLTYFNGGTPDVSYKSITAIGTLTATAGKFKSSIAEDPDTGTSIPIGDNYFEYSISGNSMTLKEASTEAGLAAATPEAYTKQ